ncbi:MAG: hypothetical protein ACPGOY_18685 [Rhodospirillaceae bacterium]
MELLQSRRALLTGGLAGIISLGFLARPSKAKPAEVMILRTYAGAVGLKNRDLHDQLPIGTPLRLQLDLQRYDEPIFAIDVFTENGEALGCLPPDRVEPVARLMMAGQKVTARVGAPWKRRWANLDVHVFLEA